jgi:hypothetical protein
MIDVSDMPQNKAWDRLERQIFRLTLAVAEIPDLSLGDTIDLARRLTDTVIEATRANLARNPSAMVSAGDSDPVLPV